MSHALLAHWTAGFLLIVMASFALIEVKSSSLIPKSLFLWPFAGFLFGFLTLLSPIMMKGHDWNQTTLAALGVAAVLASIQALLVNIRKISSWPSGAIWLGFLVVGILYQIPYESLQEPLFRGFIRRLTGFVWAAIGITKVIGDKTVSQGSGIPAWILLTYVQAILIASLSH